MAVQLNFLIKRLPLEHATAKMANKYIFSDQI